MNDSPDEIEDGPDDPTYRMDDRTWVLPLGANVPHEEEGLLLLRYRLIRGIAIIPE